MLRLWRELLQLHQALTALPWAEGCGEWRARSQEIGRLRKDSPGISNMVLVPQGSVWVHRGLLEDFGEYIADSLRITESHPCQYKLFDLMRTNLIRAAPFVLSWIVIALSFRFIQTERLQLTLVGIACCTIGVSLILLREWFARTSVQQHSRIWMSLTRKRLYDEKTIDSQRHLAVVGGVVFLISGILIILGIMSIK